MRSAGYARRRCAVVYSLVAHTKLAGDVVLLIAGAAEARAVVATTRYRPPALAVLLTPPWGGRWPFIWRSREIHTFEGGRLVGSSTILFCKETLEYRVRIEHLIAS
jgi:hypothetical protein